VFNHPTPLGSIARAAKAYAHAHINHATIETHCPALVCVGQESGLALSDLTLVYGNDQKDG